MLEDEVNDGGPCQRGMSEEIEIYSMVGLII